MRTDVHVSEDVDVERVSLVNLTNLARNCAHVLLLKLVTVLWSVRSTRVVLLRDHVLNALRVLLYFLVVDWWHWHLLGHVLLSVFVFLDLREDAWKLVWQVDHLRLRLLWVLPGLLRNESLIPHRARTFRLPLLLLCLSLDSFTLIAQVELIRRLSFTFLILKLCEASGIKRLNLFQISYHIDEWILFLNFQRVRAENLFLHNLRGKCWLERGTVCIDLAVLKCIEAESQVVRHKNCRRMFLIFKTTNPWRRSCFLTVDKAQSFSLGLFLILLFIVNFLVIYLCLRRLLLLLGGLDSFRRLRKDQGALLTGWACFFLLLLRNDTGGLLRRS